MKFLLKNFLSLVIILFCAVLLAVGIGGIFYKESNVLKKNTIGSQFETDGNRIRYFQEGSGADILYIHDNPGLLEDGIELLDYLPNGYRLTLVDRPGYGFSTYQYSTTSLKGSSDLVYKLIKRLKLEKPVIVGHGYGAGIALQFALDYKDSINGLILVSPLAYPSKILDTKFNIKSASTGLFYLVPVMGKGSSVFLSENFRNSDMPVWISRTAAPSSLPREYSLLMANSSYVSQESLLSFYQSEFLQNSGLKKIYKSYSEIKIPTVILYDRDDYDFEVKKTSVRLASDIKDSTIYYSEGYGHMLQMFKADFIMGSALRKVSKTQPLTKPAVIASPALIPVVEGLNAVKKSDKVTEQAKSVKPPVKTKPLSTNADAPELLDTTKSGI